VGRIIQDGENGLLVSPADADELATGISTFLADYTKAGQLAKNALCTVESRYSAQQMSEEYMALYDEVVSG
jgi:glycosyltransferase involved in cell wall biosynthesis